MAVVSGMRPPNATPNMTANTYASTTLSASAMTASGRGLEDQESKDYRRLREPVSQIAEQELRGEGHQGRGHYDEACIAEGHPEVGELRHEMSRERHRR